MRKAKNSKTTLTRIRRETKEKLKIEAAEKRISIVELLEEKLK